VPPATAARPRASIIGTILQQGGLRMKWRHLLPLVFSAALLQGCGKGSGTGGILTSLNNAVSQSVTTLAHGIGASSEALGLGAGSETLPPKDWPSAASLSTATTEITSFTLYNSGSGAASSQPVTIDIPLAAGDIPAGSHIQIKSSSGADITTQEDGCSNWSQDGSRASCPVSFVQTDNIAPATAAIYRVYAVSGAPNHSPKLGTAEITANTDIVLKTNNGGLIPNGGRGPMEAGTWDLISINYVLANCQQYGSANGYGTNPRCGWDIVATGPNRYGIHAFQYARRESDGALHNWIRTDMWVDFWGSGTMPCVPGCSVSFYVSEPNSFGPIAGGTVGGSVETAYVFGVQLMNGNNVISTNLGGPGDARVATVTFDHSAGTVSFPSNGWTMQAMGIFPVSFSSTSSLPAGLSATKPYFFASSGAAAIFKLFDKQCGPAGNCPHVSASPVAFSTNGDGAITATPLTVISPFAGWMGADTGGQRFWIGTSGTARAAPPLLPGHEFGYLTQKSKATPPYIVSLSGSMMPAAGEGTLVYYPNSFFTQLAVDATGDGAGDDRIGYINRRGVIALMNPNDPDAYRASMVVAAGWQRMHMYHINENTGLAVVMNNGPDKVGGKYPTLGSDYPDQRMYPYNAAPFMTPSNADENWEPIYESYSVWMEPSHMPMPQQVPFLKTGLPEWQFGMVMQANATVSQQMIGKQTINGTTYYRILAPVIACANGDCSGGFQDNQTRGVAWGFRTLDQAYHFEPDASPLKPYLRDLLADNVNFHDDVATNVMTAAEKSLGYFWNDTHAGGNGIYQWWQDDFLFQALAMNAWRGEFPHAISFVTNYFARQVIGRMDPAAGGCLWTGPARQVNPFPAARPFILANLPTSWGEFQVNTTAQNADTPDWGALAWAGCKAQAGGLITDYAGTKGQTPNGLVSMAAASAAFGAVLNIPHAASLYSAIRDMQYNKQCQACTLPLNFSYYREGGMDFSSPTFAIGPLGASR
jgi:hypothetical protein